MLLRTEHLTKDYGRYRALNDVDLDVAPGEVVGLLGPNGSGKTTALRLVLGFLQPTSGRATVDGRLVAEAEVLCKLADKSEATSAAAS